MVKLKINREDLEKMLRDQLGVEEINWDKNGNAVVEMDLDKIRKKQKIIKQEIVKEEHHHHHHNYPTYPYPIYIKPAPQHWPVEDYQTPLRPRWWSISTTTNSISYNTKDNKTTYSSKNEVVK